ncbi:MAG: VanZ family protein [Candidatus Andersenbacteria bacterium]
MPKPSRAYAHPALRWGLVLLWAGLIWGLSSIPDLSSGLPQDFLLRKLAHGVAFGVLALLARWALPPLRNRNHWFARDGYAGFIAVAYAVVDEIHQSYVPGRHGAATDVLIDGGGVVLALLLALAWRRLQTHRSAAAR